MKRKIISSGIIGIAMIGLLVWAWNHEETAEAETEAIELEEFETEKTGTEEAEYTGGQDGVILCEAIEKIDFSSKEYPIDREIYTPEVEQEYKEAFYMTITNQIPLEYEEEQTVYFRDHLRGAADLDDIAFIEQYVKNGNYRFIDCDGDGLPELVMDIGINGFCILKYLPKEQKVENYHWLNEYEVLLGSNQIGYCNPTSANNTRYGYKILDASGEVEDEIYFTVYYGEDGKRYEAFTFESENIENMSGYLNQEQWDEATQDFFAVLDCPVAMMSYEEAFGENFIGKEVPAEDPDEAVRVYDEFLAGERTPENSGGRAIANPDDGSMRYMIYDVNGDDVPELHIQTAGDYYILAYRNKVLFILFHENMEEALKYYDVCKNGSVVYQYTTEHKESYSFCKFEFSGKAHITNGFYWNDGNGNGVYDEDDAYECNGDCCTWEEWLDRAEGYLDIDKNGDVQILNLVEWKDYRYEKSGGEVYEEIDYIDDKLYLTIKDIYDKIDFCGYFQPGDTTKYEMYKKAYREVLDGEKKVRLSEEECYLWEIGGFAVDNEAGKFDKENYSYYFFDINGNGNPELCITDKAWYTYVFHYEEESDQVVLWKEYISNTIFFMGTQKLGFAGGWSGDGFISIDSLGEYEYFVRFKVVGGEPYKNEVEEYGYLVSLPEYIELSDDMKSQAVYDWADERYYFRVTEKQYKALTEKYDEAVKNAREQLKHVTYTYEELFGTMTEEEAAKAVFYFMYSDCGYDYNSTVTVDMTSEGLVYAYQTPEQGPDEIEILCSKGVTGDGQYYIFAHNTMYRVNAHSYRYDYNYHTDYAVNKETGEVLQERQWVETDEGYELLYSKEYENAITQLYFREKISDGKMSEEEAARTLFSYMYSDMEDCDYDALVARTVQEEQRMYVYQLPGDAWYPYVRILSCKGLTENKQYYVFAFYTEYYTSISEPFFTHSSYSPSFAVNRETGEVLQEWEYSDDTEPVMLYSDAYKRAVNVKVFDARRAKIVSEESVGKEQQKDTEETIEDQYLVYEHYHEIVDAEKWDMPYADEKTFEIIQSAYEEVDFFGEFEKGNLEVYDEYKKLFGKLVRNEKPFWDKETGEEIYLKDYVSGDDYDVNEAEYHFYDVDGDGDPELEVVYNCQKYIFKYDLKQEKYILWDWFGTWWQMIGTQKIQGRDLEKYYYFCQLDENAENKCVTFFFSDRRAEGYIYCHVANI